MLFPFLPAIQADPRGCFYWHKLAKKWNYRIVQVKRTWSTTQPRLSTEAQVCSGLWTKSPLKEIPQGLTTLAKKNLKKPPNSQFELSTPCPALPPSQPLHILPQPLREGLDPSPGLHKPPLVFTGTFPTFWTSNPPAHTLCSFVETPLIPIGAGFYFLGQVIGWCVAQALIK